MIEYGIVIEDRLTGQRTIHPVVFVSHVQAEECVDQIWRTTSDYPDFETILVQRRHLIFHGLETRRTPADYEKLWNTLKAWAERGSDRIDDVEAAHVLANMEALEAGEPIRE